jgi:hypothetical protein
MHLETKNYSSGLLIKWQESISLHYEHYWTIISQLYLISWVLIHHHTIQGKNITFGVKGNFVVCSTWQLLQSYNLGPFSLVTPANVQDVIPWLRYLVTGLLPHIPRLNLRPLHVWYVVEKVALAQVVCFVQALLY